MEKNRASLKFSWNGNTQTEYLILDKIGKKKFRVVERVIWDDNTETEDVIFEGDPREYAGVLGAFQTEDWNNGSRTIQYFNGEYWVDLAPCPIS